MEHGNHQPITASQIRGARAILGWSQDELAEKSHLSIATIRKIETGHISPRGKTNDDIRGTFENAGLEFIEPGGVRHKPQDVIVYQGSEGYISFFEDIHQTAQTKGGDIVAVYPSEIPFGFLGLQEYQQSYLDRMSAIKHKAKVKNILTENMTPLWTSPYIEHRLLAKQYVDTVSFHVYDDKCGFFIFHTDPSPKITVIKSKEIADAFRQQFYSMWDKATPLNRLEVVEAIADRKKKVG